MNWRCPFLVVIVVVGALSVLHNCHYRRQQEEDQAATTANAHLWWKQNKAGVETVQEKKNEYKAAPPLVEEAVVQIEERNSNGLICATTAQAPDDRHYNNYYCAEPIHKGKWVPRNRDKHKPLNSPICCGWDTPPKIVANDLKWQNQCGIELWGRGGNNITRHHYSGAKPQQHPVQIGGSACVCSQYFQEEFVWEFDVHDDDEDSNNGRRFNATRTCEFIKNKTVLIMGDSTTQQLASVLMNSLQKAGCATQIHFALSDYIVSKQLPGHYRDRGNTWEIKFDQLKPDVLVWSLGAHIYGREIWQLAFTQAVTNMTSLQQDQRKHNQSVTKFIYRTQVPGGCYDHPLLDLEPDQAALHLLQSTNSTHAYNYAEFYQRDLFALSYIANLSSAAQTNDFQVMDLRMLYNRPEAHIDSLSTSSLDTNKKRDCLHMCHPGPLDIVPELFQNLLLYLNSSNMSE